MTEDQKKRRERKLAYQRQYRLDHKEEIRLYKKRYIEEHRDEVLAKKKEYRDTHKEEISRSDKRYRETEYGHAKNLACKYRQSDIAKAGDSSDTITAEWIIENIFGSKCVYCGESDWRVLGADRLDNSKTHTPENCVPCCSKCNILRKNRYTPIEFQSIKFGC